MASIWTKWEYNGKMHEDDMEVKPASSKSLSKHVDKCGNTIEMMRT